MTPEQQKDTAKEILKITNQNFINNNLSQVVVKPKRKWKNEIYQRIYEVLGTPEGIKIFCSLIKR